MNQKSEKVSCLGQVVFIPHGGGPLPLLGHSPHAELVEFLSSLPTALIQPKAIVVISAHWEEKEIHITSSDSPELIYDYYGFPEESYQIEYAVKGDSQLASRIAGLLNNEDIPHRLNDKRGLDHGVFVPLKLMYPKANIPCIQVSMCSDLSPETHIKLGQALKPLLNEPILVVGSGFSFHNLSAFFKPVEGTDNEKNQAFEAWLTDVCTNEQWSESKRREALCSWEEAPGARFCHPREEHLLPLHVCYGLAETAAKSAFSGHVLGKQSSSYLW